MLTDTQILVELLKITEEKSQEFVEKYALKMKQLQVILLLKNRFNKNNINSVRRCS